MSASQSKSWIVIAGDSTPHPTTGKPVRIPRILPLALAHEARELLKAHPTIRLFKAGSRREAREILAGKREGDALPGDDVPHVIQGGEAYRFKTDPEPAQPEPTPQQAPPAPEELAIARSCFEDDTGCLRNLAITRPWATVNTFQPPELSAFVAHTRRLREEYGLSHADIKTLDYKTGAYLPPNMSASGVVGKLHAIKWLRLEANPQPAKPAHPGDHEWSRREGGDFYLTLLGGKNLVEARMDLIRNLVGLP